MSRAAAPLTGYRILVVEDEYLIAMQVKRWLQVAGCEVLGPVPSVDQALDLIETCCPDAAVLEDHGDDPVVEELTSFIAALSLDEQIDLVALAWLGRDDYDEGDWPAVREEAAEAHNERTATYLLGMPQLGDFLEEGLAVLGYSCEDYEIERL